MELRAILKRFNCPVCGFPDLERPAEDDNICPCCGTHFGYDDATTVEAEIGNIHGALRLGWLRAGHPWRSRSWDQPRGWDYRKQLWNIGVFLPDEKRVPTLRSDQAPTETQTGQVWSGQKLIVAASSS